LIESLLWHYTQEPTTLMPPLMRPRCRRMVFAAAAGDACRLRRFFGFAVGGGLRAGFVQRVSDQLFIRPRAIGESEDMNMVAVLAQGFDAPGVLHSGNDRHQ